MCRADGEVRGSQYTRGMERRQAMRIITRSAARIIAYALLACSAALAQTAIVGGQLQCPATGVAGSTQVLIATSAGTLGGFTVVRFECVVLDPAGFVLDKTTAPPTLRAVAAAVAAPAPRFSDSETPGGAVNGTNVVFTLANPPSPAGSLELYRNGLRLQAGGFDYTLAGSTVTFVAAPSSCPARTRPGPAPRTQSAPP